DFARSALECDASSHRFLRARAAQVEDRPDNLKRDSSGKYVKWPPRHDQRRELHSRRLKARLIIFIATATALSGGIDCAASAGVSSADSSVLGFKQWGLLAIQDGGRRKPIDTFAKETLIRITGRSTYTEKDGRKWQPNDVVLSALLETHDWKNEPMILVSFGKLKEQLGLEKTQRRFPFAQLSGSPELQRIANEARALKQAEKPLERLQQEALSVSDRLALFAHVMDGRAFLIVPAPKSETDPWLVPDPGGVAEYYSESQFETAFSQLRAMVNAYSQGDSLQFGRAANQLRQNLRALSPAIYPTESKLRLEYFYNHFDGFYRAIWLYGLGFLLLLIAHLRKRGRVLRNLCVVIALVALAFHGTGIVLRCLIGGRPPVTNMYESIICVSFASSFFASFFFFGYLVS